MIGPKQVIPFARKLYKLSLVDGRLSAEHVAGVLAYMDKNPGGRPLAVLKAYKRLVVREIARGEALVEHAGPVSASILAGIGAAMTARYERPVAPRAQPAPELLAGLRVRVGDDVYETSVSAQLATL